MPFIIFILISLEQNYGFHSVLYLFFYPLLFVSKPPIGKTGLVLCLLFEYDKHL